MNPTREWLHGTKGQGELENLQPVKHGNGNLVTLSANDPGPWRRSVATVLFKNEKLEQYVLEPHRIDINTRNQFPSPTPINKFKIRLKTV